MSAALKLAWLGARDVIAAGLASKVTVLIEGPPGGGKTSLARAIASEVDLPLVELIASNMEATDIAGLPYRLEGGGVGRALFPEIDRACREAVLLFLDELTTTAASTRGPMMRLLLERNAGGTPLHPGTRIIAACNPSDMAPSATDLDSASGNRICRIYYTPTVGEVGAWFSTVADPLWSDNAGDFAATLAVDPSLVTFEPPSASIETGAAFASPRAWELGLRIWSAGGSRLDDTGYAMLSGCVGETAATAYLAIRKLRAHLPTAAEIEADPATALVPDRPDYQIASVGLIAAVARADKSAAWIYAERLRPEIGAALAQVITPISCAKKSKHAAAGAKAQISLMAKLHKATH